jgi:predicted aminopeptidase
VFEHIAEDGGDFRAFYAEVKRLALLREERDVLSQFRG